MSTPLQNLLQTSNLDSKHVESIFVLAKQFKNCDLNGHDWLTQVKPRKKNYWLSFLFLEPSTRTRLSFEAAAARLGMSVSLCDGGASSSAVKGESPEETLKTLIAMKPDLFVIRHNQNHGLKQETLNNIDIPIISAGSDMSEHPTQILADMFTVQEKFKTIKLSQHKLLFVGDVIHSRVARSHYQMSQILGYEVAALCPAYLRPNQEHLQNEWKGLKCFESFEEALPWASLCMGLRVQKERHNEGFDKKHYAQNFCLTPEKLKVLSKEALIMHPGPYVPGEDFDTELLSDERCVVREQVTSGVYVRAAVLAHLLNWSW